MFSNLPPDEIERRRLASISELKRRDDERFEAWYQEICDREYWTKGQCCGGCDHWESAGGNSGRCDANGIMTGIDVLKSMGIEFSSYVPPPGLPFTAIDFHCGKFSDTFDWSTLPAEYLEKIGAMKGGKMMKKPEHKAHITT